MKPSPKGEQGGVRCDHCITAWASQPVGVCFVESIWSTEENMKNFRGELENVPVSPSPVVSRAGRKKVASLPSSHHPEARDVGTT